MTVWAKDRDDEQVLRLDDTVYLEDSDMQRILHRLTQAAADANMRHRMDVEDEYFSVIEKRDTEIMIKDKQLAEKAVQLAEKNVQLAEKDGQLKEKEGQLKEMDGQLKEKDGQLKEKDGQLKAQQEMLRNSLQLFLQAGMSIEEVAEKLGKSAEDLKQLMD